MIKLLCLYVVNVRKDHLFVINNTVIIFYMNITRMHKKNEKNTHLRHEFSTLRQPQPRPTMVPRHGQRPQHCRTLPLHELVKRI